MSGYGNSGAGSATYSPPLSSSQSGMYSDPYSSGPAGYGMPGRQEQQQQQPQHSKSSYTVENLASSNYTPSSMSHHHHHHQHHNAYPNIIPGPHYPVPMSAASSSNGYLFGGLESSLMQRGYPGMASHGHHPSLHHPMANAYPYNSSYGSSFDAYSASPSPVSNPGIHTPQANYQSYSGGPGSPGGSSTPPAYLQQQSSAASRPPVDLAYDGV